MRRKLPGENILYFGDTARVPYGPKSPATVTLFVRQIIQFLEPYDPKHVVMACNTASAVAMPALQRQFPHLTISGVVEPGAAAAVEASAGNSSPLIGIMGTEATIRSRAYENAILRRRADARILARATPLLVPIIEEGRSPDDPLVRLALDQYLRPFGERCVDVLVLGCTHYPILRELIGQMLPNVAVIDSADKCAEDVQRRLRAARRLRDGANQPGSLHCFVTDDSPRFAHLAARFLGMNVESPTWVSLDELHGLGGVEAALRPAV